MSDDKAAPKYALDGEAARRKFSAKKKASFITKVWDGDAYCLVRPNATTIELISSKVSTSIMRTKKTGKDSVPENQYTFKSRLQEAWAVVLCAHVFNGETPPGPGDFVYQRGGQAEVDELMNDPYEPDGILATLGKACVTMMNEATTAEEVEEAKNA